MSFLTSIAGQTPSNTFTYSTTTVSATNASFSNLSVTNASITVLTTTIFAPVNVNASVVSCKLINSSAGNFSTTHTSVASASTMNASGLTATTIVGTTGTINTVNAANLNSSIISVSVVAVDTIDGGIANFSTLNISPNANIRNLNASTITGITINSTASNISSAHISIINSTTLHSSNGNMCTLYSYNLSSNYFDSNHIKALTSFACAGVASISSVNTCTLNSCNMSTTNLSVNQIHSVFITNTSVITTDRVVATTVKANLSENFVAGTGISLVTTLGVTTITNTITGVSSPLSVSVINSSTINVCNISTLRINILESSDATQLSYIKRDANVVKFIGKNLSTDAGVDYEFYTNHGTADPRLTIFGSTNLVEISELNVVGQIECDSFISNTTITGDISPNLVAGAGISLATLGGVTTVTNTGLVTSPLSVSVINSSSISVINLSVGTINASTGNFSVLTAAAITGMTYSTQYAFLAYGNQNSAQTLTAGTVANFNTVQLCVPDATAYDTTNKRYVTPVSGLYYIGFKVFLFSTGTGVSSRMGIYKNGTLLGQGGNDSANTEAFNVVDQATAGDYYDIRCVAGTFDIYQQQNHSWIYGYLLEPANAVINATTTLNVSQISGGVGNFSTASISTLSVSNISAINASITNLSAVTSNISTLTVSNTSGINGDFQNSNITSLTTYSTAADYLYLINSNDPTQDPATIFKVNSQVDINGGSLAEPSNIRFSINNTSFNMKYDGNLNVSSSANISTLNVSVGTITTLGSTSLVATTTNITTHNCCVGNTLTSNNSTINCSIGNIKTSNCSTLNASAINSIVVGSASINNFYGTATTSGSTNTSCAYPFNTIMYNNTNLMTRVTVSQNAPAAATGIIIATAGWYKIDVSAPVGNQTYTDRVTFQGEITKNGTGLNDNAYIYTRFNTYGFRGTLATTAVYLLAVSDYIWYKITCAKATVTTFTSDFTGLACYAGGQITLTYLGPT